MSVFVCSTSWKPRSTVCRDASTLFIRLLEMQMIPCVASASHRCAVKCCCLHGESLTSQMRVMMPFLIDSDMLPARSIPPYTSSRPGPIQSHRAEHNLTGVTEVYRVAKRVEGGMKSLSICNATLQHSLRDIEIIWNNLQAFLSFSPSVLRMLPSELTLDCSAATGSENAQNETCGVCLLRTLNENDLNDTQNSVLYNGCRYHASCANFWLNCVDSNLPGLIAPEKCSEASNGAGLTVPVPNCMDNSRKDFTVPTAQ
uniref:synergin gamma-like isoform X1 n=1 Tax=Pristiophorus japonicus TaxID=55135 RepID=UPI00398E7784